MNKGSGKPSTDRSREQSALREEPGGRPGSFGRGLSPPRCLPDPLARKHGWTSPPHPAKIPSLISFLMLSLSPSWLVSRKGVYCPRLRSIPQPSVDQLCPRGSAAPSLLEAMRPETPQPGPFPGWVFRALTSPELSPCGTDSAVGWGPFWFSSPSSDLRSHPLAPFLLPCASHIQVIVNTTVLGLLCFFLPQDLMKWNFLNHFTIDFWGG